MCEMYYSNMKLTSIYCDFIESECFVWWNCDKCVHKINDDTSEEDQETKGE